MFLKLLPLFTLIPLIELLLLIYMGQQVGFWLTVALVFGTGVLGAWLAKVQGLFVLREIQHDLANGRLPTQAIVDGTLILIAGAVLLTPGLITDLCGFLLLIPPSRAVVSRWAMRFMKKRMRTQQRTIIDIE